MTSTFLRPTKERKRTYCATYVFRPITKLVKCGPYKYVKHPMYTSVLLRDISIFLLTTSWLLTLTFLCVFLVVASRIRKEEKIMLDQFGDEYREYKKQRECYFLLQLVCIIISGM